MWASDYMFWPTGQGLSFLICCSPCQAEERDRDTSLCQLREKAKAELPEEPEASETNADTLLVVVVRVRLPDGTMHQRRFASDSTIDDVRKWVSTLNEMPLTATASSDRWKLVTSFPRTQPGGHSSVSEVAAGAAAVALFVEMD